MLKLVRELFERLNAEGVRYCHWKSNAYLEESLEGKGDLDLLVNRSCANRFESIILRLGFKPGRKPSRQRQGPVFHYYGFDLEGGRSSTFMCILSF